ncbi:MAG: hypothetical protein LBQ67_00045 [Treponema sp.]|jgi:tripartite-type tricarboxylate transporter receptor subunit TctC|nr:hypothetical protein [Treponema sp.]
MKKITCVILVVGLFAAQAFAGGQNDSKEAATFKGKNVRVVIGSTSTGGDSYLIADATTRYLGPVLGANMKVDAIGMAKALDTMITAPSDGNTIMIFHDSTYLGVLFDSYGSEYSIENMTVGPRVVQNPVAAWATYKDAPYGTAKECAEYLKANPNAISRWCLESGGVSHVGFIAYYEWVKKTYGASVASRIKVILGGSTAEKSQMLWDRNCDVIFADYTSLLQYTQTNDAKIAMKFIGLLDNVEGVNVPSYADQGITGTDGKPFRFSKDFIVYAPKGLPASLLAELDNALKTVCADPKFTADLGKMMYRPAYLDSATAKKFIGDKSVSLDILIKNAPSLDDLAK